MLAQLLHCVSVCCIAILSVGILAAQAPQNPDTESAHVRARHILIPGGDGGTLKEIKKQAELNEIKRQIEAEVMDAIAKLPKTANAETREKVRIKALDNAFVAAAKKYSTCPSKMSGGDIGFFPRKDVVVEPFARAAFALEPFQISEPVKTEFGYHLILVTERKEAKTERPR
jgi:peptidyl-prolyl cis-trans isomerase C